MKRKIDDDPVESDNGEECSKAQKMDLRDLVGRIYKNYRDLKGDSEIFIKAIECQNIGINRRSLYRWLESLDRWGTNLVEMGKKGHNRLVNDGEIRVLVGSILRDNDERVVCQYSDIEARCQEWFDVSPSYETIRSYVCLNGISMHKLLRKSSPDSQIPLTEVYAAHRTCAFDLQAQDAFDNPSCVMCIDFMHDSHWDETHTGLGAKGIDYKFCTKKNRL